jgi:murein DD-endopeptidase MepM/ murein hydrolase activator NlpD
MVEPGLWTLMRILSVAKPLLRRCAANAGISCRILAATELLSKIMHHTVPLIGPALTADLNDTGISGCIACRRELESVARSISRASTGDSCVACCSVICLGCFMQLIITDAWLAKSRAIHLSGAKLIFALLALCLVLVAFSALLLHWFYHKSTTNGLTAGSFTILGADDAAHRDKYLRENIDVLARRLGEIQAKVMQLESLGERVSGLAGVNPADIKTSPGQGGILVEGRSLTMTELESTLLALELQTQQGTDMLTLMESRLFEQKLKKMMIPARQPVFGSSLGSSFGWRIDPVNGRSALHTGLDYPAPVGTPIYAAAGGIVVVREYHPQYGNMIEIDHGKDLVTRYAHASRLLVNKGDLIKSGQKIAEVGNTGRSTGPHLHFEVLVQGVPQDPQKFLTAGKKRAATQVAQAP